MREGGFVVITGLSSCFAPYLTEMMKVKRNSGFALTYMDSHIKEFDAFCRSNSPNKRHLDRELVEGWVYATESASMRELNRRVRTMRHLANHLLALGIPSYFCPVRIRIPRSPEPHIFTDKQLAEFFHVCDSFEPVAFPRYRHIVLPAIKGHKDKMSVANAERFIKKYGREARRQCAEVPEAVHPHLFRHSYGAHLYRMGFSLPVIAKLLDHESLNTTERYAETDSDMINQAFKTIEDAESASTGTKPAAKKWKSADEETLARLYGLM